MGTIMVYQEALRRLSAATVAAQSVVRVITAGAQSLTRWQEVTVSNANAGGYPQELAYSRAPGINANEWPSADVIHTALVTFHDARTAARAAWSAIPQEERLGLNPPPA